MNNIKGVRKFLYSFIICILIACFAMIAVNTTSNTSLKANAATYENQEQDNCTSSKLDSEKMMAKTREEYKVLNEYAYSSEIQAEMEKTGMTVGESLVDQICYYQQMLGETSDEQEINKINRIIDSTKNILDMYQAAAVQSESLFANEQNNAMQSRQLPFDPTVYASVYATACTAVPAAIAWFNASNYLLSAELLTHAWIENFFPGDYSPIHGNRVVGSQTTYDFINSNRIENKDLAYEIFYPDMFNTSTCYEEDLGFAIHGFKIKRDSINSTKVTITDPYDFEVKKDYNEVLKVLMQVFVYAQSFGIIGNYEVVINVDVADPLYLELQSSSNGVHTLAVHNYSSKHIDVAYNTKMCSPSDAQDWQGLSDVESITIPAKGI